MNTRYKIFLILISFFGLSSVGYSQIKQEVLDVSKKKKPEVNVKKIEKKKTNPDRYPPEKSLPENANATNGTGTLKAKDSLNYVIIDVPATSDFETSQLPPQPLDTDFKDKYYENYIRGGYGNYGSLGVDGFASYPINNNRIGGKFSHYSTSGLNKKDYDWSSSSSNIDAEAFYLMNLSSGKLNIAGNYTYNGVNYYGITEPVYITPNMDLKQKMNQITMKAAYDLYSNNYLDNASFKAGYWWDKFDTKETFAELKASLAKSGEETSILISGLNFGVEADVFLNYTNTKFGIETENKFSYFTGGFKPVLSISSGLSHLKVGGNLMYSNESETNNSKFYFYPKAEFLFHAAKEASLVVGLDGGLELHNFSGMTQENPYLLSNQELRPTNTLYKIYAGLKGDISNTFKYDAKVSYSKAENILFYGRNTTGDFSFNPANYKAYNRLNTFSALYDDGKIFSIEGSVQYIWIQNLVLTAEANITKYDLENYGNIYHKPTYTLNIGGKYKMLEDKLKFGAVLYFVGEQDSNAFTVITGTVVPPVQESKKTLESYFDLNLDASYQILPNLSVFVNGNNLLGKKYERYYGYKVLGTQVMGGVLFKF